MMTRWIALFLALGLLPAAAQTAEKLRFSYGGGADVAAAWIARDQGFFARAGLDVTMAQSPNTALFPAALQSGSLDIAAPTAPLVLQAVAGGLDLVVLSGGSVTRQAATGMVALARPGLRLATPADFTGVKVGVPGLGGFLDILFREWVRGHGVAPESLHYVELGQGLMADALRGGGVDAVVVSDPMATRIAQSGAGSVAGSITRDVPDGLPVVVYAAQHDWTISHEVAAHGFARAIAQATEYANAHPAETRATIARNLAIPPALMEAASLPDLRAAMSADDLALWLPILRGQGQLSGPVTPSALLFP